MLDKWMFRLRRHSFLLYLSVFTILCIHVIHADDLAECRRACDEDGLAYPLPSSTLEWPVKLFAQCSASRTNCTQSDLCCSVEHCRHGCALYSRETKEMKECEKEYVENASDPQTQACFQGLWRMHQLHIRNLKAVLHSPSLLSITSSTSASARKLTTVYAIALSSADRSSLSLESVKFVAQRRPVNETHVTKWTSVKIVELDDGQPHAVEESIDDDKIIEGGVYQYRCVAVISHGEHIVSHTVIVRVPALSQYPQLVVNKSRQLSSHSTTSGAFGVYVICWQPANGQRVPQPLSYTVTVDQGDTLVKEKKTTTQCATFDGLESDGDYRATIRYMGRDDGMAVHDFKLMSGTTASTEPALIFANDRAVYTIADAFDYIVQSDPTMMYELKAAEDSITAMAYNPLTSVLYIGTQAGHIIEATSNVPIYRSQGGRGPAIRQLSIDARGDRLFVLTADSAVFECPATIECQAHRRAYQLSPAPQLARMAVDVINGYMYYVTATDGHVQAHELPATLPLATDGEKVFLYPKPISNRELVNATSMSIDYESMSLLIVTGQGEVARVDLVDRQISNTLKSHFNSVPTAYVGVTSFLSLHGRMVMVKSGQVCPVDKSKSVCLFVEEHGKQRLSVQQYLLSQSTYGTVVAVESINGQTMFAAMTQRPTKLQALVDGTTVKLSWQAPMSLPFQASTSYSVPTYHVSAREPGADTDTFVQFVQDAYTNVQYGVKEGKSLVVNVALCDRTLGLSHCSSPVRINVIVPPRQPTTKSTLLVRSAGGQMQQLSMLGVLKSATTDVEFKTANDAMHVAIDPAAKRLYQLDTGGTIKSTSYSSAMTTATSLPLQAPMHGERMTVHSESAIMHVTDEYSLNAYRLTGTKINSNTRFHHCVIVNDDAELLDCPQILAIAVDQSKESMFYWLLNDENVVEVHGMPVHGRELARQIGTLKFIPEPIEHLYNIDGQWLYMTTSGRVAILQSIEQSAPAYLTDVAVEQLLVDWRPPTTEQLSWPYPIVLVDSELQWGTSPSASSTLYDVTVRDGAKSAVLMRAHTLQNKASLSDDLVIALAGNKNNAQLHVTVVAQTPHDRSSLGKAIQSPALPPTSVRQLNVYVEHVKRPTDEEGTVTPVVTLTWLPPVAWNADPFGYQIYCYKLTKDGRVVYRKPGDVLLDKEDGRTSLVIDPSLTTGVELLSSTDLLDCQVQAMSKRPTDDSPMVGAKSEIRQAPLNVSMPLYRTIITGVPSTAQPNRATPLQTGVASLYSMYPSGNESSSAFLDNINPSSIASVYPYLIAIASPDNNTQHVRLVVVDTREDSQVEVPINARSVSHLAADWNGKSLYFVATNYGRMSKSSMESKHIVRMPLDSKRVKSLSLNSALWTWPIKKAHWPMNDGAMSVDPFNSLLYYVNVKNKLTIVSLRNEATKIIVRSELPSCISERMDARTVFHQYKTASTATPRLMLVELDTRDVLAYDVENDLCVTVVKGGRIQDWTIVSLTSGVDDTIMAATSSGRMLTYNMRSHQVTNSAPLDERVTAAITQMHVNMVNVNSVGQNYADIACLKLAVRPAITSTTPYTRTQQSVIVAESDRPKQCSSILPPIVEYNARLTAGNGGSAIGNLKSSYAMPIIVGGDGETKEYTDYAVAVHWSNAYTPATFTSFSVAKEFTTAKGFPSAATEMTVTPLTSTHVLATWKKPVNMQGKKNGQVTYQTYLLSQTTAVKTANDLPSSGEPDSISASLFCEPTCHAIVEASQLATVDNSNAYQLVITSIPLSTAGDVKSAELPTSAYALAVYPSIIKTPPPFGVLVKAREQSVFTTFTLKWSMTGKTWENLQMTEARLQWRATTDSEWSEGKPVKLDKLERQLEVNGLSANQAYNMRVVGTFNVDKTLTQQLDLDTVSLTAPISDTILLTTIRGPPARPNDVVLHLNADDPYLTWQPPTNDGGLAIVGYNVQYRLSSSGTWQTVRDTATTNLTIPHRAGIVQYKLRLGDREKVNSDLRQARDLRVNALNSAGAGEFQETNKPDSMNGDDARLMVIAVVLAVLVLLLCLACVGLAYWHRRRNQKGGKIKRHRVGNEFPMNPPVVLHVTGDYKDADDAIKMIPHKDINGKPYSSFFLKFVDLPHSQRQWVTISKMLGKGAFGEVYEGLACNLPTTGAKSVRVAVKTLQQGCSNEERVKFLKEAILMNGFKHKNVVQLLGVCLEAEPHWIILELMEGGDLLSYLRDCRPSTVMPSQLSLKDLLRIIVDVARGCAYLEGEHHVHRDLAARNCLVSSRTDSKNRIVKIADFGLARDVYKVDYYRMDGKGLLPIRSMPPESLVDGVFSNKSDVWSFGVLAWEVMTLGQQPYHAMSNWEVINFVRQGGRLAPPDHCPTEIFHMMNSCWAAGKDDRPTMAMLLKQIELLAKMSKLTSDEPFPPPANSPTGGPNANNAFVGNTTMSNRSSATASTARVSDSGFDRRSANVQSMRDNNDQTTKRGKLFKSLRKETKRVRPPMAPSKEQLNDSEEARRESLHRTSWERDGRQSSAGESFTTSRADYDAHLIKGALSRDPVVVGDRPVSMGSPSSFHQPAHVNRAFSPSSETMSSAYYEMPRSTVGTASTRLSPTTPDGFSDMSRDSYYMRPTSQSANSRPTVDRGSLPPPPPAPDGTSRGTVIPIDPQSGKYSSKPTQI